MKHIFLITIFFFLTVGCGVKGKPVEYKDACNLENNDTYIEVSGYLNYGGSVYCSSTSGRMDCGFDFLENTNSQKGFSVNIEQGSSSNSVEKFESGYKKEDIKIRDDKGKIISLSDKVTVTGKIRTVKEPDVVCYIKVYKIEVK
ncbi:MAG TPA: hypothetical protein PK079_18020 [Leptospiraceae bacterium]|nr:hypothetical protein [Leptospiraceae bacterium]HMW07972.1 hypothetical protein [Leptospiraceae bacterium]HMX35107.1 hypothetical protein [Leptospiraceae bacterium]HMY34062.1 hypothetical protein [Leptospiraceae bacterium]HMZ65729.1 hypothetical protein [Leptospiraceae bacterium]